MRNDLQDDLELRHRLTPPRGEVERAVRRVTLEGGRMALVRAAMLCAKQAQAPEFLLDPVQAYLAEPSPDAARACLDVFEDDMAGRLTRAGTRVHSDAHKAGRAALLAAAEEEDTPNGRTALARAETRCRAAARRALHAAWMAFQEEGRDEWVAKMGPRNVAPRVVATIESVLL